ncbi:hypothetical protein ACLOJK_012286 [Asimina triloba]
MSSSRRSRSHDSTDAGNLGNNLYVTGLSTRVTKKELEKHFSAEGEVIDAHLVTDPWTREPRGFGFVTMSTVEEADSCIKYLNRSILEGRVITVEKNKVLCHTAGKEAEGTDTHTGQKCVIGLEAGPQATLPTAGVGLPPLRGRDLIPHITAAAGHATLLREITPTLRITAVAVTSPLVIVGHQSVGRIDHTLHITADTVLATAVLQFAGRIDTILHIMFGLDTILHVILDLDLDHILPVAALSHLSTCVGIAQFLAALQG